MPATVDSGFAAWLKAGALFVSDSSANAASWLGDKGVDTEITSPFGQRAGALAEATRQVAFLSGPNVKDRVQAIGALKHLTGLPVTLRGDRMGFTSGGIACFVLEAEEQDNGTTILTVLRRLVP